MKYISGIFLAIIVSYLAYPFFGSLEKVLLSGQQQPYVKKLKKAFAGIKTKDYISYYSSSENIWNSEFILHDRYHITFQADMKHNGHKITQFQYKGFWIVEVKEVDLERRRISFNGAAQYQPSENEFQSLLEAEGDLDKISLPFKIVKESPVSNAWFVIDER